MKTHYLLPLLFLFFLAACDTPMEKDVAPGTADTPTKTTSPDGTKRIEIPQQTLDLTPAPNPAAAGFNATDSDKKAIAIADSVVKYHGGRPTWDATRFIRFNFFGARTLNWDKQQSRVRIDAPGDNTVYLLNYGGEELTGRVRRLGDEVTAPDSLAFYLNKANSIFINDTYWLVHQFKLKDSGVTLKYAGEVRTDPVSKRPSFIIDQTFDGVGNTPNNRYRLYVDKVSYRINTWEFYRNATDEEPALQTPWLGYLPYQGLLLSGDRNGRFQLKDIAVSTEVPERTFTEF